MSAWTKLLLSISLICYLAVSSIAAVHAFPSPLQKPNSAAVGFELVDRSNMEMGPDCHQQQDQASQYSVSTCKIFCAALANVISNEIVLDFPNPTLNSEIAFITLQFHTREPVLEPHPPK